MALEVSLWRFEDFSKYIIVSKEIEKQTAKFYLKSGINGPSDFLSMNQTDTREFMTKKWRYLSELGLTTPLGTNVYYPTRYTMDSNFHPGHPFKVGLFHSPIHDGSFNSVVYTKIGITLFSIFGITASDAIGHNYIKPNWITSMHDCLLGKQKYIISDRPDSIFLKAFDIISETCDYVISNPDREKFRLLWRL